MHEHAPETAEASTAEARQQFEATLDWLQSEEAFGLTLADVEEHLTARCEEMMRLLVKGAAAAEGTGAA